MWCPGENYRSRPPSALLPVPGGGTWREPGDRGSAPADYSLSGSSKCGYRARRVCVSGRARRRMGPPLPLVGRGGRPRSSVVWWQQPYLDPRQSSSSTATEERGWWWGALHMRAAALLLLPLCVRVLLQLIGFPCERSLHCDRLVRAFGRAPDDAGARRGLWSAWAWELHRLPAVAAAHTWCPPVPVTRWRDGSARAWCEGGAGALPVS